MRERVPGVQNVEARTTDDGYIVLRFRDEQFRNSFSAKFVSDGAGFLTISHNGKADLRKSLQNKPVRWNEPDAITSPKQEPRNLSRNMNRFPEPEG